VLKSLDFTSRPHRQLPEARLVKHAMSTTEQQSKAPPEVVNMIAFLRGAKSGIKNRTGVLNGKRIDYFKGMSHLLRKHIVMSDHDLFCPSMCS